MSFVYNENLFVDHVSFIANSFKDNSYFSAPFFFSANIYYNISKYLRVHHTSV